MLIKEYSNFDEVFEPGFDPDFEEDYQYLKDCFRYGHKIPDINKVEQFFDCAESSHIDGFFPFSQEDLAWNNFKRKIRVLKGIQDQEKKEQLRLQKNRKRREKRAAKKYFLFIKENENKLKDHKKI